MKRGRKLKQRSFFNPHDIATAISEAIRRDLYDPQHEYWVTEHADYFRTVQTKEPLKKFLSPDDNTDALEEKTFQKFLEVNSHMGKYRDLEFPDPNMRIQRDTSLFDATLLRARSLMKFVLKDMNIDEVFLECKHSGGTSLGVSFNDTSMEAKSTFPITGTERVKPLFDQYLRYDTVLAESLESFNDANLFTDWYMVESGSRATTVDKTTSIRRMICVEPTANMFLQQGLMTVLYRRMAEVGLDVESLPDSHKNLARLASINGLNSTIDWSSASDCVSIELLRYLLPPKWFDIIDQCRSLTTTINGTSVELNMFSTMGNAATFPLETLVFWTLGHGARLFSGTSYTLFPEWEDLMCISVFGDDCIVPQFCTQDFISVCESVGFIVNAEKTFTGQSRFRESCGGDYLAGYNCRPFYIKGPSCTRKSALEPWLYIVLNSIIKKYISYFGSLRYLYDKEVFKLLLSYFAKYKLELKLVPSDFPDDAGLKLSYDYERFASSYGVKYAPIRKSIHGTYSFRFCRFVYTKRRSKFSHLRYAAELKDLCKRSQLDDCYSEAISAYERRSMAHLSSSSPVVKPWSDIRRKGGYVVARATSCHWQL